jgi:hypothetical protein
MSRVFRGDGAIVSGPAGRGNRGDGTRRSGLDGVLALDEAAGARARRDVLQDDVAIERAVGSGVKPSRRVPTKTDVRT